MSTAYHSQTDDQTEITNHCLETYLRCFISDQPKSWVRWLSWVEYWFNTTYHESLEVSPFETVYGRKPPVLVQSLLGEIRVEAVQMELQNHDEIIKQLKHHLEKARERMKNQADKHKKERETF